MPDYSLLSNAKRNWRASREERGEQFEIESLSAILRACAEPGVARDLLRNAEEGVTCIWFNDTFTDFPYRVSVRQFFSQEPRLSELVFLNQKSPFLKHWVEAGNNWMPGTSHALILKYGRLGTWVICNTPPPEINDHTVCVHSNVKDADDRWHRLYLMPFDMFLRSVALMWQAGQ